MYLFKIKEQISYYYSMLEGSKVMSLEAEGEIEYWASDDTPAEFYVITTPDGKAIRVGFDAKEWNGDLYEGIPEIALPHIWDDNGNRIPKKRCKITIEVL
jgi:hypothetical protein